MPYTTPPSESPGNVFTSSLFNTYLKGNLDFLATGGELDYAQLTSSITATTTETLILQSNTVAYDGSRVKIEFWCSGIHTGSQTAASFVYLYRDTTQLGQATPAGTSTYAGAPFKLEFYDTPTAANHYYKIQGIGGSSTVIFSAGAGGTHISLPAFIRVTRAG